MWASAVSGRRKGARRNVRRDLGRRSAGLLWCGSEGSKLGSAQAGEKQITSWDERRKEDGQSSFQFLQKQISKSRSNANSIQLGI